eukprot:23295-Hanusia_phi.AAC.1
MDAASASASASAPYLVSLCKTSRVQESHLRRRGPEAEAPPPVFLQLVLLSRRSPPPAFSPLLLFHFRSQSRSFLQLNSREALALILVLSFLLSLSPLFLLFLPIQPLVLLVLLP